jgi:SAM-dependent methyltransferase
MPASVCPVCESGRTADAWRYQESVVKRCRSCDLEFAVPFVAADRESYRSWYEHFVAPSYEAIHPGYRFTIAKIRQAAGYLKPGSNRVLDVGCGAGYLLVDLQRCGFECLGIDFNEDLVRAANEQFGVPAVLGDIRDLRTLGRQFDLILLSHVLEHLDQPMQLLLDIREVLAPGGYLVIEIPNRNWFSVGQSLKSGTCAWDNYPPHHLTFWSAASLRGALQRAGFQVRECLARPFQDMNRVPQFVRARLGISAEPFVTMASALVAVVGHAARLQGSTLHAIAGRLEAGA